MSPEESRKAVETGQRVIARGGPGDVHAIGKVIAYSNEPQVCIVTEGGRQVWWRADMTEPDPDAIVWEHPDATTTAAVSDAGAPDVAQEVQR